MCFLLCNYVRAAGVGDNHGRGPGLANHGAAREEKRTSKDVPTFPLPLWVKLTATFGYKAKTGLLSVDTTA